MIKHFISLFIQYIHTTGFMQLYRLFNGGVCVERDGSWKEKGYYTNLNFICERPGTYTNAQASSSISLQKKKCQVS